MRRPSGLVSGTWASDGTASEKVPTNSWTRSINLGYRVSSSPSNTVAAQSGSRPTSERTLSWIALPSGIRITS